MRKIVRNQRENETKVVCPKCGVQFAIADKTHVATGVVIGKDAGLGTIHPEVVGQDKPASEQSESKLPSKASERIEALRAVGVDVSSFFAMTGANGGESVAALKDGKLTILSDDDPIYDAILEGGDVYNWKLARRWVMSQMFHMLANEGGMMCGTYKNSITNQIRQKGYDYMWKQMEEELHAQMKMHKNGDMENFNDRNHWFNADVVYDMLCDYRYQLHLYIKHECKVKKCEGRPYKRICGKNVYEFDIEREIFKPIEELKKSVKGLNSPAVLYQLVRRFNREMRLTRSWKPRQSAAWLDAYKGSGAFFTMQNLIRYHKCRFEGMDKEASYSCLKGLANEYRGEGWRMIGVLRQFLEDNDINIEKKMAEWRKK